MKVLLKKDIDSLGCMGDVVEVARGYARNYLIPRDLAVGVTRNRVKDVQEQKKVLDVKAVREKDRLEEVADKVRAGRIVVKARCSATGKLFGSITNRQLAQEIEAVTGEEIDRHKIVIAERVRTVGAHPAKIRLHPDIELEIEFEVEGEGFVPEEPPVEEEETAAGAQTPEATVAAAVDAVEEAAPPTAGGEEAAPPPAVVEEPAGPPGGSEPAEAPGEPAVEETAEAPVEESTQDTGSGSSTEWV